MSILIKGMKMPKNCDVCFMHDSCEYSMPVGKRLSECPLIELPPHGRLIDADELIAKQQEDADLFINPYTLMEKSRRDEALNAVANIVNAPTILEAEEEI